MEWVAAFFADGRVSTILGLILLDVCLAVAAAVRQGAFQARRLAEFFRTMVVPYMIGYLGHTLWTSATWGRSLRRWARALPGRPGWRWWLTWRRISWGMRRHWGTGNDA